MKKQELDDDLPSLRASRDDGFDPVSVAPQRSSSSGSLRADPPPQVSGASNGPLWALTAALSLALVALGYWTYQQQSMLKQQLVATQTSFARISEEASGRIQDINGKFSATESSLGQAEQARSARIGKLESQVAALQKTLSEHDERLLSTKTANAQLSKEVEAQQAQLTSLTAGTADFAERLSEQSRQLQAAAEQAKTAAAQLTQLQGKLAGLEELQSQLAAQAAQLTSQKQALQALQQEGGGDVEQSLLVMRTELDQRAAATEQALDSIDSFRLQTNRSISTLQNQLASLHAQVQGN
ncbi:ATPase [Pseudomonas neustonica]|uniref:ATPase n=1 Tax=Pseudomonas neustonica TaxID=2487346 RepID=UPI003F45DE8F